MKRRNFIKSISGLAIGMSLGNKALAQNKYSEPPKYIFTSQWTYNLDKNYFFGMDFDLGVMNNFKEYDDVKKTIKFTITKIIAALKHIEVYNATYLIDSCILLKGETSKYNISASLITENNKLADQPEGFKHEKIHFVLDNKSETMGSIDLLNENQKVLASLEKAELIESGCFLTTACVGALGKKDDCYELQTLRAFRDTILKKNNKGLNLINEYYKIAPKIVNQINSSSENKVEYKNIYNKMILPTIDAIENKENQKAIDIYSEYFLFLKDTYLDNKISN